MDKVVLVKIKYSAIEENIKWEASSKGELFPYSYSSILVEAITKVYHINLKEFDFSALEN